jgi:hypothetical protein
MSDTELKRANKNGNAFKQLFGRCKEQKIKIKRSLSDAKKDNMGSNTHG